MGFMRDEFGFNRNKGALSFGLIVLIIGLPTVLIYNIATSGAVNSFVFDEYDYWAGTVSLVVFALFETVLFVWVFGLTKGWKEINEGGDIKVPSFYKPIIKWVTPFLLISVFIGSLITPKDNDWISAFKNGWELDNSSIIKKIANSGLKEQIAAATDPIEMARLQTQLEYTNYARILLLLLFAGICLMVYKAYLKRLKEGRN
jgi:hypothetical protein